MNLQASHWFTCGCKACTNNWPCYAKLPRDYLKLPGTYFKYKRCNRKELQKDVDRLKKRINATIMQDHPTLNEGGSSSDVASPPSQLELVKKMYFDWSNLLEELLIAPGHRDFVNVRRGIKNCLWLQPASTNLVNVKEDDALRNTKSKYKG